MVTEGPRPLLHDTGNGFTVYYRDKFLYSSKNPRAAARKLANDVPLLPASLVFIPSFGLGYGIDELLQRLPAQCHVLCVEHDPALMRLAREESLERFADEARLTVIQADEPPDERLDDLLPVRRALARHPPGAFRRVIRLTLCGGARLHPEFYDRVESYLSGEIRTFWQNKLTLIHLGLLYVRNLFSNLPLLPHARDLDGLSSDRPLIVAGAGPSLPRTLPLVRELGGRCAVLAVDTALPVLIAAGIVPDFILALEPQFINIRDFPALGGRSVPLIADLSSSPQVIRFCLEKRRCPLYLFSSQFHALSLLERLKNDGLSPRPIPPLGSVGVAAVFAALRVTSGPVFLAGLDFSFPFGRTHAPGSPVDEADLMRHGRLKARGQAEFIYFSEQPPVTLAAKDGGRVASGLVLSSYAENLSVLIRREGRLYDLNPFGLPLGAPVLDTPGAVMEVVERSATSGSASSIGRAPAAWSREAVGDFLGREASLLKDAISVFAGAVGPGRPLSGVLSEGQWRTVKQTDFAWYHLPERSALPEYSQAFAAQALLSGRYLLERIECARAAAK